MYLFICNFNGKYPQCWVELYEIANFSNFLTYKMVISDDTP